ncbi:hypothetical protein WJX73_000369 [Symbiochloris irregularis]|uniref:Glutaredoxin domain-containing protein n=1 Tax=Symbiochloris irregularis TaxID=706552 RepID=A0AAW1NEF6_9CHLO
MDLALLSPSTSYASAQPFAAITRPVLQPHGSTGHRSLRLKAYGAGGPPGAGLSPDLREALDKFVASHPIVLFMKGTKQFPQCGFSNTCVQILSMSKVPFETVNILEDDLLRSGMKEYSQWPTFPQVYIAGEFFGGCDIMIESFQKGELPELSLDWPFAPVRGCRQDITTTSLWRSEQEAVTHLPRLRTPINIIAIYLHQVCELRWRTEAALALLSSIES